MKRLVATGPKKCELREAPMPVIERDNEIIIKNKYCGVCRSEHYNWENATEGMSFGHEPVGVVYAVGNGVTKVKVGDRVSGLFNGGAEYAVAQEETVFLIPDNLTDEQAILEPLACLVSAVSKVRLPMFNEKVGVVGCGYMGCGAISLLKLRGAHIVAVDINKESLEAAKKYGADEVYTPDELPAEYTTVVTDHNDHKSTFAKRGLDLVMEWAETEQALTLAINMTAQCGQLAIGAYHNSAGGLRTISMEQLNVKAIDMLSTHPRERALNLISAQKALDMLANGTWNYGNVTTKVWPITQFDNAQAEITEKYGKYMKSLVDWTKMDGEPYIID